MSDNPYLNIGETQDNSGGENPYLRALPNNAVPKPENFIQKAIKSARGGSWASSPMGLIPSSGEEMMDIPRVIGSQTIPRGTIGTFGVGANLVGKGLGDTPQALEEALTPRTEYGSALNTGATIASLVPAVMGIGSLAKGGFKGIKDFFSTGALKQAKGILPMESAAKEAMSANIANRDIGAVHQAYGESPFIPGQGKIGSEVQLQQELGMEGRQLRQKYASDVALRRKKLTDLKTGKASEFSKVRDEVKTAANELAFTGREEAHEALKGKLAEFYDMYETRLSDAAHEGITRAELAERLKTASDNMGLGSRRMLSGDEATLKSLASEVHPPKAKGESISKYTARGNTKLKANDVKAFFKNIRSRMNPTDHPLSEVYNEVGSLVSEKMPEYAALKEEYKPIYETIKKTKKLFSEGAIRGLTQPTVSPTKLAQTQQLEKELGINITGKAKDIATKRGEISKQFGLDISDLREMRDKQINDIYSRMAKSKVSQSELIHEKRAKIDAIKAEQEKRSLQYRGSKESKELSLQHEIDKRKTRQIIAGILGAGSLGSTAIGGLVKHLVK